MKLPPAKLIMPTAAFLAAASVSAYVAVVVVALLDKWPAVRVGPLISAGAAVVTLIGLGFAWNQAHQASIQAEYAIRKAEADRLAAERSLRIHGEYQRRHAGLGAVAQLTAIAQRMHNRKFTLFFASYGRKGGLDVRDEMQDLLRSSTQPAMLINDTSTGQAALIGFSNGQAVLDELPPPGFEGDRWMELGKVWTQTGTWLMTHIPWGVAELSVKPEDVERSVDEVRPAGVTYTWEFGDDDRPPSPRRQ